MSPFPACILGSWNHPTWGKFWGVTDSGNDPTTNPKRTMVVYSTTTTTSCSSYATNKDYSVFCLYSLCCSASFVFSFHYTRSLGLISIYMLSYIPHDRISSDILIMAMAFDALIAVPWLLNVMRFWNVGHCFSCSITNWERSEFGTQVVIGKWGCVTSISSSCVWTQTVQYILGIVPSVDVVETNGLQKLVSSGKPSVLRVCILNRLCRGCKVYQSQ